ncbi:unnamed protein product [Didymodactylos carnosus]|uniref:Zinc finger BED domain-containing protein 4 n=1 Tax=Didymodactylos carnosus TaxID=1234261 RepID=A0A8S2G3N2_9BILA|nr:unnamed protein product [Didymodactylos carnosus]CAF4428659.1 unnamed protein product [Didymodactylos carnosus]
MENSDLITDNWAEDVETETTPEQVQQSVIDVLKKCRTIATLTKKSSVIAEYCRQQKELLNLNRSLLIDCPTRWNSTYALIESILQLKALLEKLFSDKRALQLQKTQIDKLISIEFLPEDYDILVNLQYVLKPFFKAITLMSGQSYPTVGLSLFCIEKIKQFLSTDDNNNDEVKQLKSLLLNKLDQYFYDDQQQLSYLRVSEQLH